VSSLGSVALAVLLARFLLTGTLADLGPSVTVTAPALFAGAVAWGLLSRSRLPYLADSVALALLVPARGPLCDAVTSLLPGTWGAPHVAAVISLVPVGFALGRHLGPCARDEGLLGAAMGWAVGEALVVVGAVGWMPGPFTGFVVAGLLAVMGELGRPNRGDAQTSSAEAPSWEGLPVGAALGLMLVVVQRVVPSYAEPPTHAESDVALVLMVPALLVALPTRWLASGPALRQGLFALGSLGLAGALWLLPETLAIYAVGGDPLRGLTSALRNLANDWSWMTEWHAWLLHVLAYVAAAGGVVLGCLGRRAGGPLLLGLALGLAGGQWVAHAPAEAPLELLLVACGVAGAGCLMASSRKGALLLPAAVVPLLLYPDQGRVDYEFVRRLGEFSSAGWSRTPIGDVGLFVTGDLDNLAVDGRRGSRFSFTGRKPYLSFDEEVQPPELLDHPDPDIEKATEEFYGVRLAGVPLSPDQMPLGAEGSVGRMLRMFAPPGAALLVGVGAELVAADLSDAGLGPPVLVTTPAPLGSRILVTLFSAMGTDGVLVDLGDDPAQDLRAIAPASLSLVVAAPERAAWPQSGWALYRANLERLAECLAPGGRLLAFVETGGLDARALGARLAAFGAVFGDRSLALVEPREATPPLVVLVGWRDDAGQPTAEDLDASLPLPDEMGWRTRVQEAADLGAILLADGPTLTARAAAGPVHDRGRPVPPGRRGEGGWAAVAALRADDARLSRSIAGAPEAGPLSSDVAAGLAMHGGLFFELERLRDVMMVEVLDDVDWERFDQELGWFERAAAADPEDPLLMLAVASVLEPLLREGELTRFAGAFERVRGSDMPSWRLALQYAAALEAALQPEASAEARARARELAGR
jgi:hypothetical protein